MVAGSLGSTATDSIAPATGLICEAIPVTLPLSMIGPPCGAQSAVVEGFRAAAGAAFAAPNPLIRGGAAAGVVGSPVHSKLSSGPEDAADADTGDTVAGFGSLAAVAVRGAGSSIGDSLFGSVTVDMSTRRSRPSRTEQVAWVSACLIRRRE